MKHFIKKISLMGAGKKKGGGGSSGPPPDPPRLDPPIYGQYKSYPSYSSAEIVDLICDGPIEGLVNEAGEKLINENILQGIYLDNTPISSVNNAGSSTASKNPFADQKHTDSILKPLFDFCNDVNDPQYARAITAPRAKNLWDNQNGQKPLPYAGAKENVGTLMSITQTYSKLRADGLDEKFKKTKKTLNELKSKLNKLDDAEQNTKNKYAQKAIERNTALEDKFLYEESLSVLKSELAEIPNNKANKKARDNKTQQIKNTEGRIKQEQAKINKLNKEISALDIPGKEDKQEAIINQKNEQQRILNRLKTELAAIPKKQKQNRTKKEKEINGVEAKIKNLNNQIKSLEKQLEKLGNFNQIEKIENQIEQQEDILEGIKFAWRPVDNSQKLDYQYGTLTALEVAGKFYRNEYTDGGPPSWKYKNSQKFQIHFRDATADGPGEQYNLYWWEYYLKGLIPQLQAQDLIFERDYVYKTLEKIKNLKKNNIRTVVQNSKTINDTFKDFARYEDPLLIYTIGPRDAGVSILRGGNIPIADREVLKDDKDASFYIDALRANEGVNVFSCFIPRTTWDRQSNPANPLYNGEIYGFIAISFTNSTKDNNRVTTWQSNRVGYGDLDTTLNMNNSIGAVGIKETTSEIFLKNARKSKYDVEHHVEIFKTRLNTALSVPLSKPFNLKFSRTFIRLVLNKYNFNNILNEFRNGEEYQKPLAFFNNASIDIDLSYKLTGPFRKNGTVQKFNTARDKLLDINPNYHYPPGTTEVGPTPTLALKDGAEGGQDIRSYQKYEGNTLKTFTGVNFHSTLDAYDEDPVPYTYYIENPDVEKVIVTLEVRSLVDTLTATLTAPNILSEKTDEKIKDQPGTKIPSTMTVQIDTGYVIDRDFYNPVPRQYKIVGLIESPVLIDIGSKENKYFEEAGAYYAGATNPKGPYVGKPDASWDNLPSKEIVLPTLTNAQILGGAKRYVRIYKVSAETNSVAIKKEVFVNKITEILPFNFSYPFSAIVGSKIDARNFTSIPNRSFDCRLKKIMIPSNYFPLQENFPNKDKRYWTSIQAHKDALIEDKVIYKGDWNGDLKLGWTDNPAWILYDILTNVRYGLGEYLESSSINIWEIYKIGRYCDAVNDDGLFLGVKDLYGGLEPRFSCNIMFNETTKIFDAVNTIINLFRGNIFFSNSELHFSDDRPREPIALFTNSNVANGFFNYTNNKKDESFNVVEVAYIDKLDNFKTKIEVVKDEDDIRYRGYAKTVVNTFGVTSKSMARRIGQHIIWQTTKENQGVEFTTGPEALLCRPGDLIVIEDEMKSRITNYGRILDVDTSNRTLTLDNPVDLSTLQNKITIYTPTGYKTAAELERLSDASRQRIDQFKVSNNDPALTPLNGRVYKFSRYSTQYYPKDIYKVTGLQHAVYIDSSDAARSWYYDLNSSGWIFSIGSTKTYISEVTDDGIQSIENLYSYLDTAVNKRGNFVKSPTLIYNEHYWTGALNGKPTIGGIHDDEIRTQNNRQITTYSVSGVSALSSDTEINNGSLVYLDERNFNLNLLNIVEPGSTYRLQVKNTADQIFKVLSIRENNPNEYGIVATKYDSGKWQTIENDVYIEGVQQQYSSSLFKVVNGYSQPESISLDFASRNETNYTLMGEWSAPASEPGLTYSVSLENPNIGFFDEQVVKSPSQGRGPYKIYYSGLNDQGLWTFKVQVISKDPLKYNSYFSTAKKFIGFENSNPDDLGLPVIDIVRAI